MSTIRCPDCGSAASAYGSVTHCWCDKMYCDHTQDMFATYSCACGSGGVTPQARQHQEHQEAKFLAEMARDVSALLATLPNKIRGAFQTQSVMASDSQVQVVFSNGCSAAITVTCVYSNPWGFQVISNYQTVVAKGGGELKAALASIANG